VPKLGILGKYRTISKSIALWAVSFGARKKPERLCRNQDIGLHMVCNASSFF